SRFRLN
ncbi:hypothetical protein D030_0496, partial [Vibrio parahaemolyticus AQ3810]